MNECMICTVRAVSYMACMLVALLVPGISFLVVQHSDWIVSISHLLVTL